MKINKFNYLLAIVFLLFGRPIKSFANDDAYKLKNVMIYGRSDSAIKIEVIKYPKYFITENKFTEVYTAEMMKGNFGLKIPAVNEPTYISILFYFEKGKPQKLNLYLVEAGDSVYITHRLTGFAFSGRSSLNFLCQYRIKATQSSKTFAIKKDTDMYLFTQKFQQMQDSLSMVKSKIIDSFKGKVSNNIFQIIRTDWLFEGKSRYYNEADFEFRIFDKDSVKRHQVFQYYIDYYSNQKNDLLNTPLSLYSRTYIDFILNKTRFECRIKSKNNIDSIKSDDQVWPLVLKEINSQYSGVLKQRLLTTLFARQVTINDSLSAYITKAINQITQPYLHSVLSEVQRLTKGVPAYNFSLQDENGNLVKLSDFKGKVVLLDFWYTGCHWCTVFAEAIKPIIKMQDTGIAFITVSIDRNKQIWKESLAGKRYTSDEEINLYTGGSGADHDLIKYYKITAYPSILIIDRNSKIFTVNPPYNAADLSDSSKLRKIILSALKEN